MPSAPIIAALALPPGALVDQRVPKKLLIEQGTPAAGDKKQVQDGLEELIWHAALKPTNIGVPSFTDSTREYLEIAVLVATLRPLAKRARLVELIHRAIPYPVLLLTRQGDCATVSVAHKRWSQGEAGKVVLEDSVVTTDPLLTARPEPADVAFLAGLRLSQQPGAHLHALYHGWLARVTATAPPRPCLARCLASCLAGCLAGCLPAGLRRRNNAARAADGLTPRGSVTGWISPGSTSLWESASWSNNARQPGAGGRRCVD